MKRLIVLLATVALLSGVSFAAPCANVYTLANLPVSCEASDKLFSNFVFTGFGGITKDASLILAENSLPHLHGWILTSGEAGFVAGGTWGYDMTIIGGGIPGLAIISGQLDASAGDQAVYSVTKVITNEGTTSVPAGPWSLTLTSGQGTQRTALPYLSSIRVLDTLTMTSGTVLSISNTFQQGVVPEPATMALFGSGLLALGLIRRFRRR